MKNLRGLVMGVGLLALAGCTNLDAKSEVKALNEVQPVGSPFTQALAEEYRIFANYELQEMFDYPDALHFARKGLATADGTVVMPEPVSDWNLLPEHMEELGAARGRLVVAFDLGAREIAPVESAIAQARYDCWIENQEENWQTNKIIECKNQYLDAMAALEGMIGPAPMPQEEVLTPVENIDMEPSAPMKPEEAMYLVFFDFDSTALGSGGQNVLDAVADEINSRSLEAVRIVGHTDAAGSQSYNTRLAMKRANAVRDALITRGVDAELLRVDGRGESELLVQTEDGVREPANRRAEITFE